MDFSNFKSFNNKKYMNYCDGIELLSLDHMCVHTSKLSASRSCSCRRAYFLKVSEKAKVDTPLSHE